MRICNNRVVTKKFLIFTLVTTLCVAGFNVTPGIIPTENQDCPGTVYVDDDYSCYSPGCYANMISYWHLDETIAGNVVDFYGTYDGINNGAIINQPGKVKTSYGFSSGDYVDCGDITELNSASAFTVIGWYKDYDIFGHNRHFDKGDGWNHDISGATYNGNIYLEVGNGANTYAYWTGYSSVIGAGVWYFAAFVFDGSGATNADKVKIYIDGVQRILSFGGGDMPVETADLGGSPFTLSKISANQWDGDMDEIAVFNRALSSTEIGDLYTSSEQGYSYCLPSGWHYDHFDSIQDGVDAVCDGGIVYVYSGTYQEQVYITKNVDLIGIVSTGTKPLIKPPAAAFRTTYTFAESTRTFDPIIFADGGTGTIDIMINNFEIDGLDDGGSNTFCGILLRNTASGPTDSKWIRENEIHSLWGTGQETMGIIMYGLNTDMIIHGNTVTGFSRNGITAIDGIVSINSNIVTGNGLLPSGNWAQNGIQVSAGATGDVIGNTVSGCSILNPNWAASGIICYLSSGAVNVNTNEILENEVNIYLAACSADIRGNYVYATATGTGQTYFYGIIGDPGEGTPPPAPSPYEDEYQTDNFTHDISTKSLTYNMICQSNTVESDGSSGGVGIGIYAGMYGTYNIYLTIENNDIRNWDTGIELYEYAPNEIIVANINCNNIEGNNYGIYNWLTRTFNANCNWWGDCSGPYHPIKNPTGNGDPVSDYIDFTPWIGNVIADAAGPYIIQDSYYVTFDGSASSTPGCCGEVVSYNWDFGDGNSGNGVSPTHRYSSYGNYLVTLTVTTESNGHLCTDIDTARAYLYKDPSGDPPTVVLIYPQGGEILKGTVKVEWDAYDTQSEDDISIYLYYYDFSWNQIIGELENTGEYMWDTTTLPDGTYTLLVEAVDGDGNIGHEQSETFKIKNHEEPPENFAPIKPSKPSGTTNGIAGEEYSYTSSTSDPDGDQIWYKWDWGDNNNSVWLGPYNSGATCEASHLWEEQDECNIRVKAKDVHGKESSWSDPLGVSMPITRQLTNPLLTQILLQIFEQFPTIARLLSISLEINISYQP